MRLIDADAFESRMHGYYGNDYFVSEIIYDLHAQPTIDAVQVVYCKDCKHWDDVHMTERGHECHLIDGNKYKIRIATPSDWFCPMGERRSE